MFEIFKLILLVTLMRVCDSIDKPCNVKETKFGSVCVCNATYCDTIQTPANLKNRQFHVYFTSKTTPGFNHHNGYFREVQAFPPKGIHLHVNDEKKKQTIIGVGGAFTDSFGYTLRTLSKEAQDHLLKSYFAEDGIEYSFNRVVFGSCDFSVSNYSYVDEYDPSLESFNLTEADFFFKIDPIQRANLLSKRNMKLMGSAWSAPRWMKRKGKKVNQYLLPKFRQTWANYLAKTFEAFKNNSIELWGLTAGNEPITLIGIPNVTIDNMVMMPEEQREWIANNLGPALESAGFMNKSIVLLDDMRHYALWWMDIVMRSKTASKYVDGVGIHWYVDSFTSPRTMDEINKKYPEKNIYYTESSINPIIGLLLDMENGTTNFTGFQPVPPLLGSWKRAEVYATSLIENFNHWVNGYMDWNLALDESGGPNLADLPCDAPIIINTTSNEFYKQPMFYVLGHFSKFLKPGVVILDSGPARFNGESYHKKKTFGEYPKDKIEKSDETEISDLMGFNYFLYYKDVNYIVGLNLDGSHTIIIFNPKPTPQRFWIHDVSKGSAFIFLEPESLTSVIY